MAQIHEKHTWEDCEQKINKNGLEATIFDNISTENVLQKLILCVCVIITNDVQKWDMHYR